MGQRVDCAERVKRGVNQIDDEQKERCRRQQRERDGAEAPPPFRAVHPGCLGHRARDGLQAGKEENKIITHLFPGAGQDHDAHRLGAVQLVVPGDAVPVEPAAQQPDGGMQDEDPQNGRHGRGHRVGPDQQGAIHAAPAQIAIREHRQQQRCAHGNGCHCRAEHDGAQRGVAVQRVIEQGRKILGADEDAAQAKRVLALGGKIDRLGSRPEEEKNRQQKLRQHKRGGQQPAAKDRAPLHQNRFRLAGNKPAPVVIASACEAISAWTPEMVEGDCFAQGSKGARNDMSFVSCPTERALAPHGLFKLA